MMSSSRNHFSIEPRPRMLKDFLINDSNSFSSSGFNFKSFPRRISALQAIINTVKRSIQFHVVKSPASILPRSLSRKLSKKNSNNEIINYDIKTTVRVKDIIRWKSFRDLVDEKKPQPSDLASSSPDHHHCTTTTTTTTTGSTNSTPCSSNGSSWCESDFTSEYFPSWSGNISEGYAENDVGVSEKYLPRVGSDSMKATIESAADKSVGPKELPCEDNEERSPVSVLDFEIDEDEHSVFSFDQTIANMESMFFPTNLETWMSIDHDDDADEEEEEKAKLMLNHVKATSSQWSCKESIVLEQLLMDFFVDESCTKRNQSEINEIDGEMIIRQAEAWIKGEYCTATLIDGKACVRDMDMKESWKKFDGEQRQVSLQIENTLLNLLLDELLVDL